MMLIIRKLTQPLILSMLTVSQPTILGAQFTIPFKVSEMQRAKDSLDAQGIYNNNSFTVRATHLYVKFTPSNFDQMDILESDNTMMNAQIDELMNQCAK